MKPKQKFEDATTLNSKARLSSGYKCTNKQEPQTKTKGFRV